MAPSRGCTRSSPAELGRHDVGEEGEELTEQRHLYGRLSRDDAGVAIHVSKVRSTAADQPALLAILESTRVRTRGPGGRAF